MSWVTLCGAIEIHVAPTGHDAQTGTQTKPVKTVLRARDYGCSNPLTPGTSIFSANLHARL